MIWASCTELGEGDVGVRVEHGLTFCHGSSFHQWRPGSNFCLTSLGRASKMDLAQATCSLTDLPPFWAPSFNAPCPSCNVKLLHVVGTIYRQTTPPKHSFGNYFSYLFFLYEALGLGSSLWNYDNEDDEMKIWWIRWKWRWMRIWMVRWMETWNGEIKNEDEWEYEW